MIRVSLTSTEIQICRYIGEMRFNITSKQSTERKQDQRQSSLDMCINGVFTEYAVAKALNLNFDLNCNFRKFGADLISRKKQTIDVKSTNTEGGNLNAVIWSNKKVADIFILTEIHVTHIRLIGWIERDKFLQPENITLGRNGEYYSVSPYELNKFNE